jgi:hypothetical protein
MQLGVLLIVIFMCVAHEPANNNSCGPSLNKVGCPWFVLSGGGGGNRPLFGLGSQRNLEKKL